MRCPLDEMYACRGTTQDHWGKDRTRLVSYSFNNQGFRGFQDFDYIPQCAFFGCSITFGVGVDQNLIFPSLFDRAHNYGLSGRYNNRDIFATITEFLGSDLYRPEVNMAVIWSDRDQDMLPELLAQLRDHGLIHFFCGEKIPGPRSYACPRSLDLDVSLTHPGPQTHRFLHSILCDLFEL